VNHAITYGEMKDYMMKLQLSDNEIESIRALVTEVAAEYKSVEDSDFPNSASLYAHQLPWRLRSFLNEFRLKEPASGFCVISGYPLNLGDIGATPTHWKWRSDAERSLHEQILLVLQGSLLGDLFGWATQQDGYLVHDVLPIKGHENEQLGSGSEELLWWHTEDAFHPYRADYIGFLCLRNPDNVATTIGVLDVEKLDAAHVEILYQPRFVIRPDYSHQEKNESDFRKASRPNPAQDSIIASYEKINKMNTNPEKIPVLFGGSSAPYMRLDPYFMDPLNDDPKAQQALDALVALIDASLIDLALKPGDFCFIDNYKAVHGRNPFKARYDGEDRWIKRICVTRDLRKSREARAGAAGRVIL
jgi:Fe(II)/alpha-ketoglutarate-dependent arginine beta-hydroxylase